MINKIIDFVNKNKLISIIIAVILLLIISDFLPIILIGLVLYFAYKIYKNPQKAKDKYKYFKQKLKERF